MVLAGLALSLTGCVFAAVGPLVVVVPGALVAAGVAKLAAEGQPPRAEATDARRAAAP